MAATSRPEPTLIEPLDIEAVGAALCCRFGEASAEARRLATLHDVLGTSRSLARALDDFTRTAGTHYKGIHCSADMNAEVERLTRSLMAWSDSVFAAGLTYRAWREGGDLGGLDTLGAVGAEHGAPHSFYDDAGIAPASSSAA
jgi:hypothetical protein